MLQSAALGALGAYVEQAHSGQVAAHDLFGVKAAHEGKLQEVLRRALHIGAAVDEHDPMLPGGQYGGQRRPANAPDALDRQGRAGEQRAGAAGGNHRVALALFQQIQGHGHGRVLFPPGGGAGVVLHGDDLSGVHNIDLRAALVFQAGAHILRAAHQRDLHAQALLCHNRALNDFCGGVVAAHCVNDDPQLEIPPLQ